MNTQPTAAYSVRLADLQIDKHHVLKLLRSADGTPGRVERKYHWFYESPQLGHPQTLLLCHNAPDCVIGMVTIGHRRLQLGDSVIDVGLLVDLNVESTHRSLFPALQLLREATRVGFERYPVLYGFPNIRAQPLLRRAGFSIVAQSRRYARVLRVSEYLPHQIPSVVRIALGALADSVQWVRYELRGYLGRHSSTTRHAELRAEVVPAPMTNGAPAHHGSQVISGAHTAEFLQWRFGANAIQPAELLVAHDSSPSSQQCFFVCDTKDRILHVRDTTALSFSASDAMRFWQALFGAARRRALRSVSFSCTATGRLATAIAEAGFAPRDERPVFAMWRSDQPAVLRESAWLLTDADEDE